MTIKSGGKNEPSQSTHVRQHHCSHLGSVHSQNGGLRWIDYRCPHEGPENASVGDGESPPGHVLQRKRSLTRGNAGASSSK